MQKLILIGSNYFNLIEEKRKTNLENQWQRI